MRGDYVVKRATPSRLIKCDPNARRRATRDPPPESSDEDRSARDLAAVLARAECLVGPERLHREGVRRKRDVLGVVPGALVAVLRTLGIVPAVLVREEVVRIGDRFRVLMPGDDAVAVEHAVTEGVALGVDVVHPAAPAADAP